MGNEKRKFDGLSENYDRFRPRYPTRLLQEIAKKVMVSAPKVVDAGAGTGIELEGLRPLLGPDAQYYAVDVSTDMVAIGRRKFPSVSWFMEPVEPFLERATGVDLIIAAQSFQWMDRPRFLRAAAGCLNGSGVVAIIQNNRDFTASPFLDAYESVLEEFSPGYSRTYRDFDFAGELREHLAGSSPIVEVATVDWSTSLATAEFVGLLKSSTQAQRAITAHGQVFLDRLGALLDEHAEGFKVTIPYHSELFTAQLPLSPESGASGSGPEVGTDNATVTVEAARAEDVTEIIEVLSAAFAPFAGQFPPTALRQTPDIVAGELSRWLVARRDGQVIGCVMHYAEDGYYTLCFLAARPEMQDQGLGSALVAATIRAARAAGCRQVRIALRRSLHRNVSFFRRQGFRYFAPFTTDGHDLYQLDLRAQPWRQ